MAIENKLEDDVDDDEEGAEGVETEGEGGSSFDAKKIILFVVAPLFVLIGIGAGLYFTGTLQKLMPAKSEDAQVSAKGGGHSKSVNVGAHFLEIPSIIVNLSTTDGQPRYLRLSVQLELESMADQAAVEAVMPRVVDQFQTYLRELREKDLRGSAGIYRLQIELLNRVNAAAYPVEVKDVLFQEILIQ